MRNSFAIVILILLAVAGYYIVNSPRPDPMALNPAGLSTGAQLAQEDGNVIWISLEGVRPDHLGAYGYKNTITPYIDSIAGDSLVFERCYAQSTETYRNLATMLTAQYPIFYPGSQKENVGMGFRDLLLPSDSSLVTRLQNKGHTTSAIVSSRLIKSEFGFNQGFDYFDDTLLEDKNGFMRIRNSKETWDAADAWLSRNFGRPFFLYLHFPDPAGPYDAEQNFLDQLSQSPLYDDPRVLTVSDDHQPYNQIPAYHNLDGDTATVGELIKNYDAEIAEVDFYIGKLLYSLSQMGIRDKTMIIISSMHGESLGEHGYFFNHGGNPYHNLTHIPLIINIPDGPAARIGDVVEGIDIMPTALSYVGAKTGEKISGMNLLGFSSRTTLNKEYPAFSYWDDPNVYSIIKGNYELINFENKEYRLYHVINDPEEIYDLYSPDDPVAMELERYLDIWLSKNHQRGLDNNIRRNYGSSNIKKPMSTPPPVSR